MRRRLCVLIWCAGACAMVAEHALPAQIVHPEGPLPSFEVATIKPWKPRPQPMHAPMPVKLDVGKTARPLQGPRVHFIGQIDLLIMEAFNLPIGSERRILKGPKWVDSESDRYEVEAKIDAAQYAAMQQMSAEQQHEQVCLMEQKLLADRLRMKVHFETRGESPVYALVVRKGGPVLNPAKAGEAMQLSTRENELVARAVTMEEFVNSPLWTPIGDRFVIDQTGLPGAYDFTLRWRANPMGEGDGSDSGTDLPPLFNALREQLGLNLVEAKAPLEVIVIDQIERPSPD